MRLHLAYKNVHKGAIRAADKLFESDPWSGTPGEGLARMQEFLNDVSDAYGVPRPSLILRPAAQLGWRGGMYDREDTTITVTSISVLMVFHQFRHHLQFLGRVDLGERTHPEFDAQGWACSLYYKSDPGAFRRLVYEGAVWGMEAEDLEAIVPDGEFRTLTSEEQDVFEELCEGIVASLEDDEDLARAMEEIAREEGL